MSNFDTRTSVSELIEGLKLEIASLSGELNKALEDSVYVPMTVSERHVYEEKCEGFKRLVQELAQPHSSS